MLKLRHLNTPFLKLKKRKRRARLQHKRLEKLPERRQLLKKIQRFKVKKISKLSVDSICFSIG